MTSQERKERSSMRGAQSAAFQEMSFEIAAQGWLFSIPTRKGSVSTWYTVIRGMKDVPTEQNDYGVALSRDETEHEHVLAPTVVTLRRRLSEWTLSMENNLLMFRADEMVHDV